MKKILLNSLPKSGTNLALRALSLMGYSEVGALLPHRFQGRGAAARYMRWRHGAEPGQGISLGVDSPIEVSRAYCRSALSRLRDGQVEITHAGGGGALLEEMRYADVAGIVVTRDPRAVLNSFVHYVLAEPRHVFHAHFCRSTEEERFRDALQGVQTEDGVLQPLLERCKSLSPWLEAGDVLHLKFEDLVGGPGGGSDNLRRHTLKRLARWVGADQNSPDLLESQLFGTGGRTFRSGRVDSWITETPPELLAEVEAALAPVLKAWAYEAYESR